MENVWIYKRIYTDVSSSEKHAANVIDTSGLMHQVLRAKHFQRKLEGQSVTEFSYRKIQYLCSVQGPQLQHITCSNIMMLYFIPQIYLMLYLDKSLLIKKKFDKKRSKKFPKIIQNTCKDVCYTYSEPPKPMKNTLTL